MSIRIEKISVDEVTWEANRTSFITEVVAADLWLTRDWVHDHESMAAVKAPKHATKWRSTTWWIDRHAQGLDVDRTQVTQDGSGFGKISTTVLCGKEQYAGGQDKKTR